MRGPLLSLVEQVGLLLLCLEFHFVPQCPIIPLIITDFGHELHALVLLVRQVTVHLLDLIFDFLEIILHRLYLFIVLYSLRLIDVQSLLIRLCHLVQKYFVNFGLVPHARILLGNRLFHTLNLRLLFAYVVVKCDLVWQIEFGRGVPLKSAEIVFLVGAELNIINLQQFLM